MVSGKRPVTSSTKTLVKPKGQNSMTPFGVKILSKVCSLLRARFQMRMGPTLCVLQAKISISKLAVL